MPPVALPGARSLKRVTNNAYKKRDEPSFVMGGGVAKNFANPSRPEARGVRGSLVWGSGD